MTMDDDERPPVTVRKKRPRVPEINGINLLGVIGFALVSAAVLAVSTLGVVAVGVVLNLPVLILALSTIGVVLVGVVLVGIMLGSIAWITPEYLSIREFVVSRLSERYGQTVVRHDAIAEREYPDLESFASDAEVSDTNE